MFYCRFTEISEMLPGILNQLGAESLSSLKKLASTVAGGDFLRKCEKIKEILIFCIFFVAFFSSTVHENA